MTTLVVALAAVACGGDGNNMPPPGQPDADVPDECEQTCGAPNECCDLPGGRICVNTEIDRANCGGCGLACSAETANGCGGGECKCGFGPACKDGKTCVSDVVGCRDLQSDPQNCGSPAHACGVEEDCIGGECSCGGETCAVGETCCGGKCTQTKTDPENCGSCHNVCEGQESACNAGSCGCPGGGTCPDNDIGVVGMCCGTGCSNVCNDKNNCGACGHVCPGGGACTLGGCAGEPNPDPELCLVNR